MPTISISTPLEEQLPIPARVARLVQTESSMQGMLSDASINVIKREIIKALSLETENDTDLESVRIKFLRISCNFILKYIALIHRNLLLCTRKVKIK